MIKLNGVVVNVAIGLILFAMIGLPINWLFATAGHPSSMWLMDLFGIGY